KGWTTATDFMQLFAVAQAAPGPNVLITSLIGYRVAGFAGSLVALFAMCLPAAALARSEEHTSELQSRFDLVCRLLLEKKKYPVATFRGSWCAAMRTPPRRPLEASFVCRSKSRARSASPSSGAPTTPAAGPATSFPLYS